MEDKVINAKVVIHDDEKDFDIVKNIAYKTFVGFYDDGALISGHISVSKIVDIIDTGLTEVVARIKGVDNVVTDLIDIYLFLALFNMTYAQDNGLLSEEEVDSISLLQSMIDNYLRRKHVME